MLTFRIAVASDSARLTEIALTSKQHWGYSDDFMAACRKELTQSVQKIQDDQFHFKVAELDGEIIGFFCLELLSKFKAEIDALFISPDFIGKGYGRQCWETLKTTAHSMQLKKIVIASDPNALPFYMAMGAIEVGRIASESINGRYLPLLHLNL